MWVRPQDVLWTGRRQILVRVPVPTGNEVLARDAFREGVANKLGVLFATVCEMDGVTCCHAWVPADEDEAARSLMSEGLKFSVTTGESRLYGKAIKNRMVWFWLQLKHHKHQERKDWIFRLEAKARASRR